MDTHVYIDGFNLYYGLLRSSPFKWLNLEAFCDQLLPKNDIKKISYFTARVTARPHDPGQPLRQQMYLRALATLPRVEVHFGTFLSSVIRQPLVAPHPTDPRKYSKANGKPVLKAFRTPVKIGLRWDDKVAIIDGVKSGDQVAAAGQIKLQDGSTVAVTGNPPPQPPAHLTPQ